MSKSISDAVDELLKAFGPECLRRADDKRNVKIERISSGSRALDGILGGGWPRGRMVEVFGNESGGKTTIALEAIASMQRKFKGKNPFAVYVDAEHSLSLEYAQMLGVDLSHLHVCQPSDASEAMKVVMSFAETDNCKVIVLDSVAALVTEAVEEADPGQHHIANTARLLAIELPKVVSRLNANKGLGIFINQNREKPGVSFGNPEYQPGGRALKFYTSIRVRVQTIGQPEKDGDIAMASQVRAKAIKNKTAPPFQEVDFMIRYGCGFDRPSEVVDGCVDAGIIEKRGSHFWLKEGSNGKPVKIGQGKSNVVDALRKDQGKLRFLEKKLLQLTEKKEEKNALSDKV